MLAAVQSFFRATTVCFVAVTVPIVLADPYDDVKLEEAERQIIESGSSKGGDPRFAIAKYRTAILSKLPGLAGEKEFLRRVSQLRKRDDLLNSVQFALLLSQIEVAENPVR